MGTVTTVRGEVAGEDLGVVDYHEHLCFDAPDWLLREDADFRLNDVERSAEELRAWALAGGRTMIEMSAIDFGRNIRKVAAGCRAGAGGPHCGYYGVQQALFLRSVDPGGR